jgi:hypothetical protein
MAMVTSRWFRGCTAPPSVHRVWTVSWSETLPTVQAQPCCRNGLQQVDREVGVAGSAAAISAVGHKRECGVDVEQRLPRRGSHLDGHFVPCLVGSVGRACGVLDDGIELSQVFQAELALVFQPGSQGGQMIRKAVSWSNALGRCVGHRVVSGLVVWLRVSCGGRLVPAYRRAT